MWRAVNFGARPLLWQRSAPQLEQNRAAAALEDLQVLQVIVHDQPSSPQLLRITYLCVCCDRTIRTSQRHRRVSLAQNREFRHLAVWLLKY